jgi:hypothetical protein
MKVPILSGITSDQSADLRTSYPRNLIPVPKSQGASDGYLRPADGIILQGSAPGVSRGSINWNGTLYRVLGTSLCSVSSAGTVAVLGDVGAGGQCSLDYSFDRLGVCSGGRLYYWNGTTLTQVTDPDLGVVLDLRWVNGYWLTTDGTASVVTDLTDPASVNPLHYGSAESDPDPIKAVDQYHNEVYLLGRHTIQVSQNVGGDGYPFQDVPGAQINKGIVGTYAYSDFGNSFAFVGSGRNEAPGVYMAVPGDTQTISTREIEQILGSYTEAQLSAIVVESRREKSHEHLYVHLPDKTLVYDGPATQAVGEPVWFTLDSGLLNQTQYLARDMVWCYDRWNVADPASGRVGYFSAATAHHWGITIGWQFGTTILYADGNDALLHEVELVTIPGRAALGANPTVWTSYSLDGVVWSQEQPKAAGKQGQTTKRLAWRRQGRIRNIRLQRFRGTSDAMLSMLRLEVAIEPLMTRPGAGNGQ